MLLILTRGIFLIPYRNMQKNALHRSVENWVLAGVRLTWRGRRCLAGLCHPGVESTNKHLITGA